MKEWRIFHLEIIQKTFRGISTLGGTFRDCSINCL